MCRSKIYYYIKKIKKKSQNNKLLMKQQLAHNHFPNNSIAFHLTDINSV